MSPKIVAKCRYSTTGKQHYVGMFDTIANADAWAAENKAEIVSYLFVEIAV